MKLHRIFRNYPRIEYLGGIIAVVMWAVYHYIVWTEERIMGVLNIN